jgi:hypothetical protein
MHLVYSALQPKNKINPNLTDVHAGERVLRYLAYQKTCEKYQAEIAAIRKYFPGWAPEFR